jgi:hypothetical protein
MTKARGSLLPLGRKSFLIIKTLCLDGFRSFSNARLDFLPGQNYIFGQNWQGKSSIVDAIGFALFGLDVFPKKVAGTPVSADHLVNEDCKQARVQLDFVLNDDSYTIERILPGRQVTLKNGDTIAASGTRTVAEKLNSLLSVDVKLFPRRTPRVYRAIAGCRGMEAADRSDTGSQEVPGRVSPGLDSRPSWSFLESCRGVAV